MKNIHWFVVLYAIFTSHYSAGQDVYTPESTCKEVLHLISTGNEDWEAFRSLFVASATFSVVSEHAGNGPQATTFALEDFVRIFLSGSDRTFTETELRAEVNSYNGIAQVWQTYEADINGNKNQGINAIQLIYHNNRWWITNVVWSNNSNGASIPDQYLPH